MSVSLVHVAYLCLWVCVCLPCTPGVRLRLWVFAVCGLSRTWFTPLVCAAWCVVYTFRASVSVSPVSVSYILRREPLCLGVYAMLLFVYVVHLARLRLLF